MLAHGCVRLIKFLSFWMRGRFEWAALSFHAIAKQSYGNEGSVVRSVRRIAVKAEMKTVQMQTSTFWPPRLELQKFQIPATTSPPPEIEDHRRRLPEADPTVSMTRIATDSDLKDRVSSSLWYLYGCSFSAQQFPLQPDVLVSTKKKSKKAERKVEWPDLDSLDMALLSTTMGVRHFCYTSVLYLLL